LGKTGRYFSRRQRTYTGCGKHDIGHGIQGGEITINSETGTTTVSGTVTVTGSDGKAEISRSSAIKSG